MINRVLFYLGWCFVALAFAGVALPLLPATPFVLLAAACFARSSPDAYRRLVESPVLGPVLRDWQQHRGLSLATKFGLLAAATLIAGLTIYFNAPGSPLWYFASASVVITIVALLAIPTVRRF